MIDQSADSARIARFKTKYQVADSGCWEWTGCKNQRGYGTVNWRGKCQLAHRVAIVVLGGHPEPAGLCVCHHCDNPGCINPNHLFVGTNADNVADRERKGRRRRPIGELNPRAIFTREDVLRIRQLMHEGMTQVAIAAMYGTRQGHISRIKLGRLWSSVQLPGQQSSDCAT